MNIFNDDFIRGRKIIAPRISIGLPIFNVARYLDLAIRSIYAQSLQDWELVVVDDGSTDGGIDFVRALQDPRIRILGNGKRVGLAARLNQIASVARGHYLARMDADDLMHPERLARQVEFLDAQPNVDVVGCALLFLDANLQPAGVQRNPETHDEICANPIRAIRMAHATMVARTAWFRAHPYDETNLYCEDWQLLYNSRADSQFANLSEALYFYRVFESFSLEKYAACKTSNAHLWWKLPRAECPLDRTLALTLRNYFDIGVYAAAGACGLQSALIRRRCKPTTDEERTSFARRWEHIRNTPLPGIDRNLANLAH